MMRIYHRTRRGAEEKRLGQYDPLCARLQPLKYGKAVTLSMEYYRSTKSKTLTKSLVTLVPGTLLGLRPEIIQVSIVGTSNGACLVDTEKQTGRSKLMLIGMPRHLAQALMDCLSIL